MSAIDQINQGGTTYEIVPEIAELFSIEKTYRAGDHVIYEAGWYTFKADKYAGAWDATKVDGPFKVTNRISELKEDLTHAFPHDTVSGAVASFSDGADDVPMDSVVVSIDPVQSGSGDPSPDNVRPISGWSEVNVQRTGKNLLDADSNLANYKQSDGSYHITSSAIPNTRFYFPSSLVGKQVTISAKLKSTDITNMRVCAAINNVLIDGNFVNGTTFAQSKLTVVPMRTADYIRFDYSANGGGGLGVKDLQLEFGDAATDYESYQTIQFVNIQLGQTVYGGTLDVVSGVLTVDKKIIDGGTVQWNRLEDGKFYSATITDAKAGRLDYGYDLVICSIYKTVNMASLASIPNCSISMDNGKHIQISDDRFTDKPSFETAMSGVQFVYDLATPLTIQLTAHEIRSLLGSNNVWADTGDTEVTYRADPTLFIQRKITEALSALS